MAPTVITLECGVNVMGNWSQKIVVKRIKQLDELEIDLSADYIARREPSLYNAAVRRGFSDWRDALRAAGVVYILDHSAGHSQNH